MGSWWNRSERLRSVVLVLVAMVALWEALCWALKIRPFILPAPSLVLKDFISDPGYFLKHSGYTLLITSVGFIVAVILGVACAVGIVYSKLLDRILSAVLVSLNAVPKVALAPLFVIWLGTGTEPKIAISIMIAIFPIVIDTVLAQPGQVLPRLALQDPDEDPFSQRVAVDIRRHEGGDLVFAGGRHRR